MFTTQKAKKKKKNYTIYMHFLNKITLNQNIKNY